MSKRPAAQEALEGAPAAKVPRMADAPHLFVRYSTFEDDNLLAARFDPTSVDRAQELIDIIDAIEDGAVKTALVFETIPMVLEGNLDDIPAELAELRLANGRLGDWTFLKEFPEPGVLVHLHIWSDDY